MDSNKKLDYCILVNTVSDTKDIWEMFTKQLMKFFPNQKIYIFTDLNDELFSDFEVLLYDKSLDFRTQYLNCISQIREEFCINMNDDYILYNSVNVEKISDLFNVMKMDSDISFIRVTKGYNNTNSLYGENLYELDIRVPYFYSQTVSLWKTKTLTTIHELCPPSEIGRKGVLPQLEVLANFICQHLNLRGLYYYDGESKRGQFHYDSSIFPYIASALVGGKWNLGEYEFELSPLLQEYKIDKNLRGYI